MEKPRLKVLFHVSDRKHFSFLMQVINRGHPGSAGGYAEVGVLNGLEFLDKRWCEVLGNEMAAAFMKRDRIRGI